MDIEKILKTGQEQAVAAWVNYLNQVRLDRLCAALGQQDENLKAAMEMLGDSLSKIKSEVIGQNRGGEKGMHGFIAEIAECGIENARKLIKGQAADCQWLNDDGPVDIKRGLQDIQMKFSRAGGHLSLKAIEQHMQSYPDYLKKGGIYQIPKDHYERIRYYLAMPKEEADKQGTGTGDFSLRQWKEVHELFDSGKLPIDKVEPAAITYDDVQVNSIEGTIDREKHQLRQEDQRRRDAAYEKSKPGLGEGAKAAASSAAIEGLTAFGMAIHKKRKAGKNIAAFGKEDWLEIAEDTGTGVLKGGVRGISIYALTNYTATPAAVASAMVSASFSVADQVHQYRTGHISQLQLIENSESMCLDAGVSALSSLVGQALIPIPVLGAVIGNTVGSVMYQIAKDNFSEKEKEIINSYLKEIEEYNSQLSDEFKAIVQQLNQNLNDFIVLVNNAFAVDIEVAFKGSIELAERMGVPREEILDSREKVRSYFMD